VPEPLLDILKLCLLALLYLFFVRVMRAVWSEVTLPRATPAAPQPRQRRERRSRGRAGQLVIIEPAEHKGRSFPLGEELTVGRAAGCHVTVDDNYVSQLHARVFTRDGQLMVEDLGSTNGTYLNRTKVTSPIGMKRGDRLKVGMTVMEIR